MPDDVAHLRDIIDERDKRYEQRFTAAEAARIEAKDDLSERLRGMNEIRDQLRQQAETFVTKIEVDGIKERMTKLELLGSETRGKGAGVNMVWVVILGIIGLALAAVGLFKK